MSTKKILVTMGEDGPVVGEIIEIKDGIATAKVTDSQAIENILNGRYSRVSMGTFVQNPECIICGELSPCQYHLKYQIPVDTASKNFQLIAFSYAPDNQLIYKACVVLENK